MDNEEYYRTANALDFNAKEKAAANMAKLAYDAQAGTLNPSSKEEIGERIERILRNAKREVQQCEELLELLKRNPDTQRILDLLKLYL